METDFQKYASLSQGISPMTLGRYTGAVNAYLNPSIIEERKLNCASMDVFSRLMMDRIIFLGVPIDDDVANQSAAEGRCKGHDENTDRIDFASSGGKDSG